MFRRVFYLKGDLSLCNHGGEKVNIFCFVVVNRKLFFLGYLGGGCFVFSKVQNTNVIGKFSCQLVGGNIWHCFKSTSCGFRVLFTD